MKMENLIFVQTINKNTSQKELTFCLSPTLSEIRIQDELIFFPIVQ